MKPMTKSLAVALALSLFATACFDGSGSDAGSAPEVGGDLAFVDEPEQETVVFEADDSTPDDVAVDDISADDAGDDPVVSQDTAVSADDDRPCEGGAFPDDDEFHQLLCDVQWAQIDLLAAGAEINSAWVSGGTDAIMLYGGDRDAAVAALEALVAEMTAAMPDQATAVADPATAADVSEISAATVGARDCMVEVGELIVTVTVSGDFDPTEVAAWSTDAAEAAALAESGDLAGAEELVCAIRDEIVAAVAAMA